MSATVLVVDDSLTVRMSLLETLAAAGFDATARGTIAEARAALADNTFALIILDVLLPDGDGIDLLRAIRENPATATTPIMLLSTEAAVADRVRGITTGADDYVGKPYEPAYLVARARELIERTGGAAVMPERDTILVIDDSATFREALRGVLEAAGFGVVAAVSGEEGLHAAARERPTAIIVDGELPGTDGAAVISRIRLDAALRNTPCLLLTGAGDAEAELRALDAGADAFVRKDDGTGVVLARLGAMLRSAATGQSRRAASLHAPKRILAVDDSETFLQALSDALRGAGYEVMQARSGELALELLAVQPVDCVLLDLVMPGIGGEVACRRIKAAPATRDTPVIMLTALEDREAIIRGLGVGADDYIAKSSGFEVLRARVLAQLRRKQFEDENRRVREELLRKEIAATEAQAAREVAEARAALAEEQRVRTQMERAAALLEAAPDAVVIADTAGRITMVNARTERVFGYPRDELLGQPVTMLIPQRWHDHLLPLDPAAGERELFGRRKDGSEFPAAVSLSPLATADEALVIGTIRDVTERKQIEASLRASEARYRELFETSLDLIVITDSRGRLVSVSPSSATLLGYEPAELAGRSGMEIVYRDDLDNTRNAMRKARRSGAPQNFECRYVNKQGGLVTFWWRGMWSETSHQYVFAGRDVTERNEAERRIHAQLQHLHLLDHITRAIGAHQDLHSIFDTVVTTLADSLAIEFGCICLYDDAADRLQVACIGGNSAPLGDPTTSADAAIGIDDNGLRCCLRGQLVYEPDIAAMRYPFPERLARGGLGSLVLAPLRSESRVFGILVAARRAAHAFTSVECEFLRQLSEHVALAAHQAQLYGALQQAYDDLRQTQEAMLQEERLRALGQMASGIAHDINNALSPVSLYTEAMLEGEAGLSERARAYLQTIQRAVDDVSETVARMRAFYRQREAEPQLAAVSLNRMVEQVIELTRARWADMPQESGLVIRAVTRLTPDLPPIVGVESEIREALTNLVFNAVDAMPEGGILSFRTAPAGTAGVVVEVADTGIGMDEEVRRRCLEPFFTTKGERGTGLGLAMVFGIVQRHGGDIEIDSAPGRGTVVRLVFAAAAGMDEVVSPPSGPRPPRLRLLLIDDDPILLKSLRDALEGDGHVIVAANGGEQGIATLAASIDRGEPFAAVITDLGMPYLDGRRVAAAVKAAAPELPVILLTGWGRQLAADGEMPPHVDCVLAKPPKLHELRDALSALCHPAS